MRGPSNLSCYCDKSMGRCGRNGRTNKRRHEERGGRLTPCCTLFAPLPLSHSAAAEHDCLLLALHRGPFLHSLCTTCAATAPPITASSQSFLSHSTTDDACNSLEEQGSIFLSFSPAFSACHVVPLVFSLPTDFGVQSTVALLRVFATSWTKLNILGR